MLPPPYHYRYYLYPEVAEVNALAHRKILARYAQRPCVAGYMIGEEDIQMDRDLDNGHLRQAFADYLKQRYHTLDALKAAWGAGYDYTDRSLLRPTPRKLDAWNLPDCEEMVSTPAYPLVSSPWAGLSRWQDVPLPEWPLFRAATSPYAELASFPALNTFTPNDPVWIDYNAFREDVLYLAHVNRWAAVVRPAAPNQWLFHCNAQDFTAHWMFPMCYRRAELDFDVISTGSHDTGKDLSKCTPAYRMRKYFANVAAYRPYVRAPGSRAVAIAAGEGEGGAHDNEQEILNYHRAQTFELLGHGGAFEQAYRWTHLSGAMASPEAQPHLSKALQWMGEFYRAVDGVPFSLHRPVDVLIVGNNNLARSNRGGRDIGNIMAVSDSLGQLNIEFDIAMDLDLAYGMQQRKIDISSYRMLVLPCIDSDYPEAVWQVLDAWLSDPAYRGRRTLVLGHIGRRTPHLTPAEQFHPTLAEWLGFANYAGEVALKNANELAWTPVAPGDIARTITINFGNRDLSPAGTFREGRPLLATSGGEVVAAAFAHAGNAIYAFGFPLGLAYDLPWGIPAPQTPYDTMGTVFEDLVTAAGIPRPVRSPHNLRVAVSDDQSIIMIQERFGIATTDLCRLKVPAGTVYEGCETVPQTDGTVLLRAELKPYEGLFFRRKPQTMKPTLTSSSSALLAPLAALHAAEPKPNVLFIAVDDLRPWIGAMGFPAAKTPNLDRLAARSVTFSRAYTAAPWCQPSRTALLTGLRPSTTGVYAHWDDPWRASPKLAKHATLPQYFRQHGYETVGAGKIFHHSKASQDPASWDRYWPSQSQCMLDHGLANPPLNGLDLRRTVDWGPSWRRRPTCRTGRSPTSSSKNSPSRRTARASSPAASTCRICPGMCHRSIWTATRSTRSLCLR